MEALFVLTITIFVLLSGGTCELCNDLDTDACHRLVAAKPDFCNTSPIAGSACKRTCGQCGLTCYHCPQQPVSDSNLCTNTQMCLSNQTCIIKTVHAHDGHIAHLMSCGDKRFCEGLGFGFMVGKRDVGARDLSLHCCHTDLCNVPGFTTTTKFPTLYPVTVPTIYNCQNDIVFVLDESGSIGQTGFLKAVDFITDLVKRLDIGIHETQVGFLVYDDQPHVEWYLNDYTNKAGLLGALTYVPYHDGNSRTDLALQYVRENMFQYKVGDRITAKNVVVVITDGRSSTHAQTVIEAKKLHDQGVLVVAVGVGNAVNGELRDIASDSNHAIKVVGFDHFPDAIPILLPLIC